MASSASISGFDEQGSSSLLPVYHFNALAIHYLAPFGGQIIDLGSGTGRFLAYLAARRPDLKIIGLDLAEEMVNAGRQYLASAGLDDRVRLLHADMREFRKQLSIRADLVSSVFSMHHLTARDDLFACLNEIAAEISGQDARMWIFDHVRPRRQRTVKDVPEIFTPTASPVFCEDSRNSLCASWSFDELCEALRETLPVGVHAARSRLLPLYQIHWTPPRSTVNAGRWIENEDLQPTVRREAHLLSLLFRTMPGKPGAAQPRSTDRASIVDSAL